MAAIWNLGSLNIDRVLRVPRIVRPGETLSSQSVALFAGGKGANQSVALARAGANVRHIGQIGENGLWLRELLAAEGVNVEPVRIGSAPTGEAIIQVDDAGQNAIVLVAGANHEIVPADVDQALVSAAPGDWLLVQNETSGVAYAMRAAKLCGLRVAFNPAPFDLQVDSYPLESVDLLCLNETEGEGMTGQSDPEVIGESLSASLPNCEIVLTLGSAGAICWSNEEFVRVPACDVTPVDTTAAGDTFFGYYLAAYQQGLGLRERLAWANRAAALCVTRAGASDSIPRRSEVLVFVS